MLFSSDRPRSDISRLSRRIWVLATGIGVSYLSIPALAAPDPAQADVPGIAPAYRSAFAGYRGWQDGAVRPWIASNDATARAGGWRTYAREAARDAAAPTVTPSASTVAVPPPARPPAEQPPAKGSAHAHH